MLDQNNSSVGYSNGYSNGASSNYLNTHSYATNYRQEPDIKTWVNDFWNLSHVICRTFDTNQKDTGGNPIPERTIRLAYICFFESLSHTIPNEKLRNALKKFIAMDSSVKTLLLDNKELQKFFMVHRDMVLNNRLFYNVFMNSTNSDIPFMWGYLFHCYWDIINGYRISTYNDVKIKYEVKNISKNFWGNALWSIIHHTALFCQCTGDTNLDPQWCKAYKAFISCLRYCLPCPMCRGHLEGNLGKYQIDRYMIDKDKIFEFTVDLHNSVNNATKKPLIRVEEAKRMYYNTN